MHNPTEAGEMGAKLTKSRASGGRKGSKMSKETMKIYYRAEFESMGDVVRDGRLSKVEFFRLMTLLGLPDVERAAEKLWKKQKKAEGDKMTVEEYVSLMMDAAVDAKTNIWRKLFAEFDSDGTGYASPQEVTEGLTKLGIPVEGELKAKIARMDSNKDGRIYYGDFLKMQLLGK